MPAIAAFNLGSSRISGGMAFEAGRGREGPAEDEEEGSALAEPLAVPVKRLRGCEAEEAASIAIATSSGTRLERERDEKSKSQTSSMSEVKARRSRVIRIWL